MSVQLRPANLGEILDRTANLYRSRFLVFLGIAAIPAATVLVCAAGVFLLAAWMGSGDPSLMAALGVGMVGLVLLALPICVGVVAFGTAALTHAAARAYFGEPIAIRSTYQAVWKRGWRYIGLFALQVLFLAVVPFIGWVIIVGILAFLAALGHRAGADASTAPTVLLLLFGAALLAYFVWMLLRLCLAFPACVVESIGAWAALRRAILLSQGTRGRIFVLYLLLMALNWIVSIVLTVPVVIVVSLVPPLNTPQHSQTLGAAMLFLMYGASFASQAFTKPVSGIALTAFYYDQRIRKEAFDIEWMMRQAGMVAEAAPEPEVSPWLPAHIITARPEPTPAENGAAQHGTAEGPS